MSRSLFPIVLGVLIALLVAALGAPVAAATSPTAGVSVHIPRSSRPEQPFVVKVRLPPTAAAVDGRILLQRGETELWGIAPVAGGTALRPEPIASGYAFGAYGLHAVNGSTVVRLVLSSHAAGHVQLHVAVDAIADGRGLRLAGAGIGTGTVDVKGASHRFDAPRRDGSWRATPQRPAGATRDLLANGRIDRQDLDTARLGWDLSRLSGTPCGAALVGDANGDGCVDIVDVQAELAAQGRRISLGDGEGTRALQAAAISGNFTFTVTSTADSSDATPGDGLCADSSGSCTLRAAITEANWDAGNDLIAFNLPGPAPVTIPISTQLPNIGSRSGTLTIDGYTQPGSQRNTAAFGTNATQGIEIKGPGVAVLQLAFYITSVGNTLRGLLIDGVNRGIFVDQSGAHDNRILGNWIGYTKTGTLADKGQFGVILNSGAYHNVVGTPDLADRNVIGNVNKGVDQYGAGTNFNVIQNNVFFISPLGATAQGQIGTDHDFGPKNDLVGGFGPNEKNVYGPTGNQGIELSHGWNPSGPKGATDPTWEISGNHIVGNWVGFRQDGNYDAVYRSGRNKPQLDNGNAINVIDGARNNIIESNYIGALQDGIQLMHGTATGNIVRNNIIGVSPLGQPAPLTGWGMIARMNAQLNRFEGNTIRNAALGGVGLLNVDSGGQTQAISQNITVTGNIITDTNGPAIYLAPDPSDVTTTANHGIQPPAFTSVSTTALVGTADPNSIVEVYRASRAVGAFGLPTVFIGSASAGPDGIWAMAVSLPNSDRITALQTDVSGDTSQLASNVLVGAPPPPPQPDLIASDDFERTVSPGWGAATQGGAWALIGAETDFSVSGGLGRMNIAANVTREARLPINRADVNIAGQVSFDRLSASASASLFAYIVARANDNTCYRTTIRVASSGAVYIKMTKSLNNVQSDVRPEINTGVLTTGGGALRFRFRIVANHLQFRAWNATGPEPTTWNSEADDSSVPAAGSVGLRAYISGNTPNGPVQVSFDNYEVRVP